MKYLSRSVGQIFRLYFLIYAILVVVFAIEQFDAVLRKAVAYDASLAGFSKLFLYALPEVADFIIPVSVLVSVYFVLLSKREGREFLTLAAAGSDLRPVVILVSVVSALFFTISVFISGYVKPAAAFAYRSESLQAVTKFVSQGPRSGRFTQDGNKVFYVSDRGSDGRRALRMFEFDDERLERVIVSDCSNLMATQGKLIINLCAARVYAFSSPLARANAQGLALERPVDCRICKDESGRLDLTVLDVAKSAMLFSMDSSVREALGVRRNERQFHSMLAMNKEGGFLSDSDFRDAVMILLLALTNVLAVSIAVYAVGATSYHNRFIVLPGAISVVMMISVAANSGFLVPDFLPGAIGFMMASLLATILCLVSIPAAFIVMRSRLLMPGLGRA